MGRKDWTEVKSPAQVKMLREVCDIPANISIEPAGTEIPLIGSLIRLPFSTMALLEGGVRFPLNPLLVECLARWRVLTTQININVYRIVNGVVALNSLLNLNLGFDEIMYCYRLQYKDNRMYLQIRPNRNYLVTELPDSSGGKDHHYVYCGGLLANPDLEFTKLLPVKFGFKESFKEPVLSKTQKKQIRRVWDIEDRSAANLLGYKPSYNSFTSKHRDNLVYSEDSEDPTNSEDVQELSAEGLNKKGAGSPIIKKKVVEVDFSKRLTRRKHIIRDSSEEASSDNSPVHNMPRFQLSGGIQGMLAQLDSGSKIASESKKKTKLSDAEGSAPIKLPSHEVRGKVSVSTSQALGNESPGFPIMSNVESISARPTIAITLSSGTESRKRNRSVEPERPTVFPQFAESGRKDQLVIGNKGPSCDPDIWAPRLEISRNKPVTQKASVKDQGVGSAVLKSTFLPEDMYRLKNKGSSFLVDDAMCHIAQTAQSLKALHESYYSSVNKRRALEVQRDQLLKRNNELLNKEIECQSLQQVKQSLEAEVIVLKADNEVLLQRTELSERQNLTLRESSQSFQDKYQESVIKEKEARDEANSFKLKMKEAQDKAVEASVRLAEIEAQLNDATAKLAETSAQKDKDLIRFSDEEIQIDKKVESSDASASLKRSDVPSQLALDEAYNEGFANALGAIKEDWPKSRYKFRSEGWFWALHTLKLDPLKSGVARGPPLFDELPKDIRVLNSDVTIEASDSEEEMVDVEPDKPSTSVANPEVQGESSLVVNLDPADNVVPFDSLDLGSLFEHGNIPDL